MAAVTLPLSCRISSSLNCKNASSRLTQSAIYMTFPRRACRSAYVEYLADLLIAAELEQRVKIVEMLNKDGLIAGLEERLDRLKKEDDAHEKQNAA